MSDGNKKQRHQFLNYLEDYQEIGKDREVQEEEERQWVQESNEKYQHKQKFVIWIFILLAFFLLIIIGFWWNVSRDKFYKAMHKPLTDNKFQEFLLLVDEVKNANELNSFDWKSQLELIDDSEFDDEEREIFNAFKDKIEKDENFDDLTNDINN